MIHYIDRQLTAVFHYDQVKYQRGLAGIQHCCLDLYGKKFEMLDHATRIAFMQKMESGGLPGEYWTTLSPAGFFNLVTDHTMQGFYGAPRHGGNRDYMSYRMMDLEYPLVIGRNHYNHSI